MLRPEDKPLFFVLLGIVFALFVNAAVVSFSESPQRTASEQGQTSSDSGRPSEQSQSISFWQRTVRDPINLFTAVLAVFTIILAGASIWQGLLNSRSITLERDRFNAAYRPEIIIQTIETQIDIVDGMERVGASVTAFNKGRVGATNIIVRGRITRSIAPSPQTHFEEIPTRASTIGKGLGHQFYMHSDYPISEQALLDSCADEPRIWCVGVIYYHSQSGGIAGQTGFGCIWNSEKQEWQSTDKPGFNYEL